MASTKVSPDDVYGYLSYAKREGYINGFRQTKDKRRRVIWLVEVPSTRYDYAHDIPWATIALTSREVCAFMEGIHAANKNHPTTRPGAYRATWEEGHISPNPIRADLGGGFRA